MRYLFTTDRVEFAELDDLIINPGNAPVYRVPTMTGGILRRGRRESDRVSFTSSSYFQPVPTRLFLSRPGAFISFSSRTSARTHLLFVTMECLWRHLSYHQKRFSGFTIYFQRTTPRVARRRSLIAVLFH